MASGRCGESVGVGRGVDWVCVKVGGWQEPRERVKEWYTVYGRKEDNGATDKVSERDCDLQNTGRRVEMGSRVLISNLEPN